MHTDIGGSCVFAHAFYDLRHFMGLFCMLFRTKDVSPLFFTSPSGSAAELPDSLYQRVFSTLVLPFSLIFSSILSCRYKLFGTLLPCFSLVPTLPPSLCFFFLDLLKALNKIYLMVLIYFSYDHLLASKDCKLLLSELARTADLQAMIW